MVNRYAGKCAYCSGHVPANGGNLVKKGRNWMPVHLACQESGKAEVVTFTFSSGQTMTRNSRGRCEDAPCCGCCS